MPPQRLPLALGSDVLCCMGLGFAAGMLRLALPRRGRACFWADFLLTGLCLVFLQSFGVSFSRTGALRWYMAAGAGLGALAPARLFLPRPAARYRAAGTKKPSSDEKNTTR